MLATFSAPAGTGALRAEGRAAHAFSVISIEDYLFYVDEALEGMIQIVEDLSDELANRHLDVPGGNAPYSVLTHCLGVMEYWAGHLVAGRRIERDRDAEFVATGSVADLVERTRAARRQLGADLAEVEPSAPPRWIPRTDDAHLPLARTQGGALVHVFEELAQHRGQMEITRDVLRSPWAKLA